MKNRFASAVVTLLLLATAACSFSSADPEEGDLQEVPKGCNAVDIASSPEKLTLLTDLADRFNQTDGAKDGTCAFVRVHKTSSGTGAQLLADGWPSDQTKDPKPVIYSPSASSWGAVLNQRLVTKGEDAMAPTNATSFMLTPLVIAMPKPMADALGYPQTPIGFADLAVLAKDPQGWAGKGHPEWGAFKLGKTNPNFSTSALSATTAQYYAKVGKTQGLTKEDIQTPEVDLFMRDLESSVVHYGDTTLTFLNNLYRSDRQGRSLTYVSAVAVEEKSVIDYNTGNPDGILDAGESPRKPRVPLVAVYPKEGTIFSDNPLFILDAPWVTPKQKEAAKKFEKFVLEPANQRAVLQAGFRPGNPKVALGAPITKTNGVDPLQPSTTLEVPTPQVLVEVINRWGILRKGARVLVVIDVSGSMGDPGDDNNTKLDLAKEAAIIALDQFKDEDLVGLRIFSSELGGPNEGKYLDLVPIGPIGQQRERIATSIRGLIPVASTPLYTVAADSFRLMRESFDPTRINAVVLLTDGVNEDDNNDLQGTLNALSAGSEGQQTEAVRLFTIAYGGDADLATLKRLAEATNGANYDASDPTSINKVFTAVLSNF